MARAEGMNPYDVLGVGPHATQGEIEAAFQRLSREQHFEEDWQRIVAAHALLSDRGRRADFDGRPRSGLDELGDALGFAAEIEKPPAQRDGARIARGLEGALALVDRVCGWFDKPPGGKPRVG